MATPRVEDFCPVPDCGEPAFARGYCSGHYRQVMRGQEFKPIRRRSRQGGPCQGPDCDRLSQTCGYCTTHYQQVLRGRGLQPIKKHQHVLSERDFQAKTAVCSKCGPVRIRLVTAGSGARARKTWTCAPARGWRRTLAAKPWMVHRKDFCERCGLIPEDISVLEVDHINGRKIDNPHDPSNLQTLCANCHRIKTYRLDLFIKEPPRLTTTSLD